MLILVGWDFELYPSGALHRKDRFASGRELVSCDCRVVGEKLWLSCGREDFSRGDEWEGLTECWTIFFIVAATLAS